MFWELELYALRTKVGEPKRRNWSRQPMCNVHVLTSKSLVETLNELFPSLLSRLHVCNKCMVILLLGQHSFLIFLYSSIDYFKYYLNLRFA